MPVIAKQKITPRATIRSKRPETREEKMISALSPTLNVMVNAVRRVGKNIVHDFREVSNLQISEKGPGDFVSNADLYAEKKLIEFLHEARPDYGFLSEECGAIPGAKGCDYVFIVDPIDGTNNFIHALPIFAISVALMKGDKVIAGVVFNPVTNELYYAEKGKGSFLMTPTGNVRLRVAGRRQLKNCLFATNGYSSDRTQKGLKGVAKEFSSGRYLGSAALSLAMVAMGQIDVDLEFRFHKWDVAAAYLLIQEAGGKITAFDGNGDLNAIVKSSTLLAANPVLHALLLPQMAKSLMK